MGLTSRERVLTALNFEEPDRVPMDLGSSRSTGINANAYNQLKQKMGYDTDTVCFDVKQNLAYPDHDLLRELGVDVVILPRLVPSVGIKIDRMKKGQLPQNGGECLLAEDYNPVLQSDGSLGLFNEEGIMIAKRPKDGLYYDEIYNPLKDAHSESDIDKNIILPNISDEECEWLIARAKHLRETTDFAISGATSTSIFEYGWKAWGLTKFMENLYLEPELMEYYLDKMTDAYIVMMEKYLDAVGEYVDIVQNNDDFGTQSSMLISPDMYREFFKERHAKINTAIKKKKPDVKIYFHSDGAIMPIIPDIIESGYDILNPIQKETKNMNPAEIKKKYGKNIAIWGAAISTQTTMTHGTVDDIIAECKDMIRTLAPGGGFVYSAIHNIQADISPEKILAVFETGKKYGVKEYYG